MDLLTYLKQNDPQELIHVSGDTWRTRQHDSLQIYNGKWMWWSQMIGGKSALDQLIKVQGLTFMEAMETLTQESQERPEQPAPGE